MLAHLAQRLAPVLAVLAAMLPAAVPAADTYDVSYLWHSDAVAVVAYRERVSSVLGPAVAKDLIIVTKGKLSGLVYDRKGDHAGAVTTARVHTKLLKARGLEPAAAVPTGDWRVQTTVAAAPGGPTRPAVKVVTRKRAAKPLPRPRAGPKRHGLARSRPVGPALEAAVESHIKRLRKQGKLSRDERTGWSVYDFTTGEKLVTINEDKPFQAASLIKPFIAAAFLAKVASGKLTYGPHSRRQMERMIQRSDNRATNWVARRVGGPRSVERLLTRRFPDIFRQTRIVEYIPANGRTYRNRASLHDYSRFLHAVWNDRLPGSPELKRLMALPGPDRIVDTASRLPEATRVYNKTGSTGRLCGDMGILIVTDRDGREYPYTLIGVIEKQRRAKNYTQWIRSRSRVIGEISDIVYASIAERHGLDEQG